MLLEVYIKESLIDLDGFNIDQFLKTNKDCVLLINAIIKDIEKICKDPKNCEKIIDFIIKSSDKNLKEINEDESKEKNKIIDKYSGWTTDKDKSRLRKKLKKLRKFKKEIKLRETIALISILSILGTPIVIPMLGKLAGLLAIALIVKWSHDFGKEQGEFDAKSVNNKFSNRIVKAIKDNDYKKVDSIKKEMKEYIIKKQKEAWKSSKKAKKASLKEKSYLIIMNFLGSPFKSIYMSTNFDDNIKSVLDDSFILRFLTKKLINTSYSNLFKGMRSIKDEKDDDPDELLKKMNKELKVNLEKNRPKGHIHSF
tara:strand:+ start:376 stop:1308 length:933 start_codon:yes stop_codon:yes gene_type:complete